MAKQAEERIAEKRIAADILIAAFKTTGGSLKLLEENPDSTQKQTKVITDAYEAILKAVSSSD